MIVIMRDAVMPECCKTCVCSEGYGCGITGTEMTTKEMESRPDWCPLEEVEPCGDAVSRQAAIDEIKEIYEWHDNVTKERIIEHLGRLPSAQPERWDTCFSCPLSHGCPVIKGCTNDQAEQYAGEIPTDCPLDKESAQPEIVRCKDCKYRMPYDWMFSEVWQSQNMDDYQDNEIGCQYCDMSMTADDFCSRAERREE